MNLLAKGLTQCTCYTCLISQSYSWLVRWRPSTRCLNGSKILPSLVTSLKLLAIQCSQRGYSVRTAMEAVYIAWCRSWCARSVLPARFTRSSKSNKRLMDGKNYASEGSFLGKNYFEKRAVKKIKVRWLKNFSKTQTSLMNETSLKSIRGFPWGDRYEYR